MRAAAPWAVAAVVLLVAPAAAFGWTVDSISTQLMCPVCHERLDQSTSPEADRIRAYLARAQKAGESEDQVKRELVAQFGPEVLAAPPRSGFGWAAWLVPAAVLLAGGVVAVVVARRWAARGHAAAGRLTGVPVDEGLERRLDAELERFE
jgi:cytochrome c-type biogenesis protein CcmH